VLDSVGKPEQHSEAPVLPPKPGNLDDNKHKMNKLCMLIVYEHALSEGNSSWLLLRITSYTDQV
jgi:hypothetical protein